MNSIIKFIRLTLFFVLLLIYTFFDYFNSSNSGFDDSNRGGVYLFLIILVIYILLYLLFNPPKKPFSYSYTGSMFAIAFWILMCNILTIRFDWSFYVHLFMSIWWIGTYYFFLVYCMANPNSVRYIITFFSLMLILYLYFSFTSQTRIQINKDSDHAVVNYAYNIFAFIPIILLIKKKFLRLVLLSLSIVALLLTFKRGPLVMLPVIYLVYQFGMPISRGYAIKKIFRLIFVIVLFIIAFSLVDSMSGGYLSSRFTRSELQYGSARDELWALAIDDIKNRDFTTLLIGKGSGSSIHLLTSGVHNEWLEFLFTYGIIGVLLYLTFGISLFRKFVKMRRKNSEYAPIVGVLVAFFWMVGLFSGFYFVHSTFYFFATMGVVDALNSRHQNNHLYES